MDHYNTDVYTLTIRDKGAFTDKLNSLLFIPKPEKVSRITKYYDKYLVRYEVFEMEDLMGHEPYRNIWCFHEDGRLLWRIQQDANDKKYCDIYSGIFIEKDTGKLKAATGFGMVYDLDIETGQVSNPDFRK